MKWLITGGCGFIGANLADHILQSGMDVVILDNLSRTGSSDNLSWLRQRHGSGWRFEKIDVRDREAVLRLVSEVQPTIVAHLAGQVAMTTSIENPYHDFETNATGTLNVLEAVRCKSADSIVVYSSTNKVYGSLSGIPFLEGETRYIAPDYPAGFDEGLPLDAISPYGCSKLSGEQYVRDYFRTFGIRTVVFRHSSVYGGRQFSTFDQGWIGWFCRKACEMENADAAAFTISGDGKQVRDILHANDIVRVYEMAVRHIQCTAGNVYNIGGGMKNSYSLLELFQKLEELTGHEMRFTRTQWRHADQRVFVADFAAAQRDFDWAPTIGKEEGIMRMLAWTRERWGNGR